MNKRIVKGKEKLLKRFGGAVVAIVLVAAMVMGLMPSEALAATFADANTAEGYELSLGNSLSTEYAGRIWSDKSVYSGNAEFEMFGGNHGTVEKAANEDFLVAFSALGTSQTIIGQTEAPLDIVFVIDMSGSMRDNDMDNGDSRLANTIEALNSSIDTLLNTNEHTRIGVVAYAGEAITLLELDHYQKLNGYNTFISTDAAENTIYTRAVGAKVGTINKSTTTSRGTNIQRGIFDGMNMLASVPKSDTTVVINGKTTQRIPSVVLLSDGAPTIGSTHTTWWDLSNDTTDYSYDSERPLYGMQAIMTASYMKAAIDRNYSVAGTASATKVYSIGMGINDISEGWGGSQQNEDLAFVTIDPANHINKNSTHVRAIREAWATYQSNNYTGRPTLHNYTFTHPAEYDVTNINYVDHYYDADNATEVTDVFAEIVTSIQISSAQVPTEIKGSDPINDGYITYTDPIGEYMTVGDVKAIAYAGTLYTQSNVASKNVSTTDGVTTYVFTQGIQSAIYGEQNLDDIIIQVSKDANGNETMTIKVPASVIPVRINTVELDSDGNVKSHTNNGAYPVRVIYSVNLKDEVKTTANGETIIDVTKLSQEYKDANTNNDGTINFYSNLYTGTNKTHVWDEGVEVEKAVGNTTVEFEPSHSNPFYYMQEDVPIYTDEDGTIQAASRDPRTGESTPLVDGTTYYYVSNYYENRTVATEVTPRTGAQLKKTDIIEKDGYWYRVAGSPRLNRILEFEGTKATNTTGTAEEFYAPTFQYATGSTDPYAGKYVIYLGNNGLLQMKASGLLEISKEVEIPAGLSPAVTEFEFTVNLNGNQNVAGAFHYDVVDAEGTVLRVGTIADGGTVKLSDGQKAIVRGLTPGLGYEVTEKAVSGYNAVTSGGSGTIVAGETAKAEFTNTYSVTSTQVTGVFEGTKVLAGRDWVSGDEFTFFISGANNAPLPAGYDADKGVTVGSNDASDKGETWEAEFDFGPVNDPTDHGTITFTEPGLYHYTIYEKEPDNDAYLAGMSYSRALFSVTVSVEDNGDGTLKSTTNVQKLYTDDAEVLFSYVDGKIQMNAGQEAQDAIVFTNTYKADSVVRVPVATKSYTDHSGENPLRAGMFTFKMTPLGVVDGNALDTSQLSKVPMPDGYNYATNPGVTTVNEGENITFLPVTFTQTDVLNGTSTTYRYQMEEVFDRTNATDNGNGTYTLNGMTYDGNLYTIDVTVSLNAGSSTVNVNAVYPNNDRVVRFRNSYAIQPTSVTLGGTKTLTGRDMKNGEEFTFSLTAANDAAKALTLPSSVSVTGGTDGTAKAFSFDAIQFTNSGTYKFEMKEVLPDDYEEGEPYLGITYDTHSSIITVQVNNVNGQLVAEAPVYEGGTAFNNTYKAVFDDKDTVSLGGVKTLSGRNIINGEFTFSVTPQQMQGTNELAPMGDSYAVTAANASGQITLLRNVTYDKAGTYVYLIKEILPAEATSANNYTVDGVQYDTTEYRYTVVVEDVAQLGVLDVTTKTLEKNVDGAWQPVTGNDIVATFNNEYNVTPAERKVPIMTKILTGERAAAIGAGEFEFTMHASVKGLVGTSVAPAELGNYIQLTTDADGPDANGILGPVGTQVGTIASGVNSASIDFGYVRFLKEGIYTLTFAEVAGTDASIEYTSNTLVATFKVTDDGHGAFTVELMELLGQYSFTNTYKTNPKTLNFDISKKFTGRENNEWLSTDAFEFEVVILDEATQEAVKAGDIVFPAAASLEENIQKVVIDHNIPSSTSDATVKTVTSSDITVNKMGVYKFRIHEVAGNIPGVNYDSTPYDIVVTATDAGSGDLNLDVKITANGQTKDSILFENKYDKESTELSGHDNLVIQKAFTGRANNEWRAEDAFTFTLKAISATDSNGGTLDETSSAVLELPATTLVVNNSNKARPHFGNIVFHEAGTYVFEVKEEIPDEAVDNKLNGITYDSSIYRITVVVVDNQQGELVVDNVTYNKVGTDGEAISLAFNNTYATESVNLDGETYLKVTKVLTGRNWNDNDSFEFTLTPYDAETRNAITAEEPTVILNGTTVTLTKAEQEKAFGNIEFKAAGTYKFRIKETTGSIDNVTYDTHSVIVTVVVADNNEGSLVMTDGTSLVAAAPIYAGSMTFENTYTPDAATVTFNGNKVLRGRTLKAGEFRFHLEALTAGAPVPAQATVANSASGAFTFGQIIYTETGVYEYQISEMKGNLAGITYDENPVKVTVTVTYDADAGELIPVVSYEKAGQAAQTVAFENTYTTSATDPINLSAHKDVTPSQGNNFVMNGGEFKFEVEPAAGNPDSDPIGRAIVTNDKDGKVLFANASFTEPGVYTYTVHEVDGDRGGITYDDSVYTITVTVEDDESVAKLKATMAIVKNKGEADETTVGNIHFNNGYNPTSATAIIHGHKYLSGGHKELEKGEFTFELKAIDNAPMPEGAVDGKITVKNEATGLFQFGVITYDAADTYEYEIREVNEGKSGYTYDVTVHKVTVKVTDLDENNVSTGELKSIVEGIMDDQNNPLVTFTNTYVPGTTSAAIGGTKKLTGREMKVDEAGKGEFEFALLDETGAEIRTATNASEGETSTFTFEAITYDRAGTYVYTIVEKNTNISGVTYDLNKSYLAEVTVTDRDVAGVATGQLAATVKYYANNEEVEPEAVVFQNTYKAASTKATLGAAKVLSGRTLKANEFTFKLEALTEGAPMPEAGKETATNNAAGAINFGEITFEKAGTYEYQISEVKGEDAHIAYDTAVHKVTIEVTDDLEGQLSAQISGIEKAVFKNAYKAMATSVQISALKELKGRDLKAGEFKFVLEDEQGNKIYAVNAADGTILFDEITYTEAGTYTYKIYEEKGTAEFVTYDDKVYTVIIVVEDDFNGKLSVTSEFDASKFVFKNTYKNPDVVYTGDSVMMIPVLAMFVLSAGYILVSLMRARRK